MLRLEFFGQDEASLRKTSEENFGFFGDIVETTTDQAPLEMIPKLCSMLCHDYSGGLAKDSQTLVEGSGKIFMIS